jgi:hypothetical protein
MPWWGWLLVSVLGAICASALAGLGYLLHCLYHMWDGM